MLELIAMNICHAPPFCITHGGHSHMYAVTELVQPEENHTSHFPFSE